MQGGLSFADVPNQTGAREILWLRWRYEDDAAQTKVAAGMASYAGRNAIHPEALLLLGDNWYGALDGGVNLPRWHTQFEAMYPSRIFDCPAYAVLGQSRLSTLGPKAKSRLSWLMPGPAPRDGRCRPDGTASNSPGRIR